MKSVARALVAVILLLVVACEREEIVPDENDTTPPLPPTGVAISAASDGYCELVWKHNTERDMNNYIVYRSDGNDSSFLAIDTTENDYFIDEHLSYDTTYFYALVAVDISKNQSQRSRIVSTQSPNRRAPDTPDGLTVHGHASQSGRFIEVQWIPNDESDLAGYEVYRAQQSTVPIDAQHLVQKTESASFFDSTNIVAATQYFYAVRAYDRGGTSSDASQVEGDLVTEIPTLISPQPFSTVKAPVILQWRTVPGASQYRVTVSMSPIGNEMSSWYVTQLADATLSSSYRGPYMTHGKVYYWRVSSITTSQSFPNAVSETRAFQVIR